MQVASHFSAPVSSYCRPLFCQSGRRQADYTFGSVAERENHPSEKRACLSLEEQIRVLIRWMVDICHKTPHPGLEGRTPLNQWEADLGDGDVPLKAAPNRRRHRMAFGVGLGKCFRRTGPGS